METTELGTKLAGINQRLQANAVNTEELKKREESVVKSLQEKQEKLEGERKERQQLLVTSKDTKTISSLIRKTKDDLELIEDEAAGLQERLISLASEEKGLREEKRTVEESIQKLTLISLVKEYNKSAAELAKIVAAIWDLRDQMAPLFNEIVITPAILSLSGNEGSALTRIPYLLLQNERTADSQEWIFYRDDPYINYLKNKR